MLKSILAYCGFVPHTEANLALHDLRRKAIELTITNRNLMETMGTLEKAHLSMHRQVVEAQKGLANAEEEIKHLKQMLIEQAMSPVTQAVTSGSPAVTRPLANLL